MDYGDIIVHIFDRENRLFYDLERIWRDGKEWIWKNSNKKTLFMFKCLSRA